MGVTELVPYDTASYVNHITKSSSSTTTSTSNYGVHHKKIKCCCNHRHLSSSNKLRTKFFNNTNYSWLNISIILLVLVFPLILESTISSCSPVRTGTSSNEQNYQSQKHQSNYRLLNRFQRNRPLSIHDNNMETDSSASLSIVSPLDILRQNLLLEIHRQRLRHAKTKQVESNRAFLEEIG